MTYSELANKAKNSFQEKIPFVLFSFPESKEVHAYFQNSNKKYTTDTFEEWGFVMAPFDSDQTALIIPREHSVCFDVSLPEVSSHPTTAIQIPNENKGKEHHIKMVNDAISEMSTSTTNKIVLSRKKDIKLSNFDVVTLANQIFTKDYNGLKYLWYHPETEIWCGTTPETLLNLKGENFTTMSLAGTQTIENGKNPSWTHKEEEEQNIVTHEIFDALHNITPVLKITKPYTHRAGTVAHLRTDITGVIRKKNAKIKKFVDALHPTPAVCGTPFKASKDFILKNEDYSRQFYTGFLGNINCQEDGSRLFVNLRSMKIANKIATLFVGGGILKQSDAEEEWEETQNKLQTMLKVVAPML